MTLANIFDGNAGWVRETTEQQPDYFKRLADLPTPEYLWIGCADCRIPANVMTGLEPGEIFVHRNVANLVCASDLNCMAVLQYAVDVLKVKHIIVTGHYDCTGVATAYHGHGSGLADYWLEPVKQLTHRHRQQLAALPDAAARINFLCEENVRAQVANVENCAVLRRARDAGQDISVHGCIYDVHDGLLRKLNCSTHV